MYIKGRLQTRQWEDQDGRMHYTTEVVAEDLILLDSRPQAGAPAPQSEAAPSEQARQRPLTPQPTPPPQRHAARHRPRSGAQSQSNSEPPQPVEQADDANRSF